jgi:hypothetical protein
MSVASMAEPAGVPVPAGTNPGRGDQPGAPVTIAHHSRNAGTRRNTQGEERGMDVQ